MVLCSMTRTAFMHGHQHHSPVGASLLHSLAKPKHSALDAYLVPAHANISQQLCPYLAVY